MLGYHGKVMSSNGIGKHETLCWGDWGEMKLGQVETVAITFMAENAQPFLLMAPFYFFT